MIYITRAQDDVTENIYNRKRCRVNGSSHTLLIYIYLKGSEELLGSAMYCPMFFRRLANVKSYSCSAIYSLRMSWLQHQENKYGIS